MPIFSNDRRKAGVVVNSGNAVGFGGKGGGVWYYEKDRMGRWHDAGKRSEWIE